ncbi:hypothetical protein D3C87_1690880 [compost metagenome]
MNLSVAHGQRRAARIDRAFLRIIDQVEIRVPIVDDEQALEQTARIPFGNLHVETLFDAPEGLFLDDGREQVGIGCCDHLAHAEPRCRFEKVCNRKGNDAEHDGQPDDRPINDAAAGACRVDNRQLRVVVHRCQRLGDADDEGERHDDRQDRR